MKDFFGIDEEFLKRTYLELRGTLDHDMIDAIIIVSTIGTFYVDIDGKEFKL